MSFPNLPFYKQSKPVKVLTFTGKRKVFTGKGYIRMRFISMRLGRDFVSTSILAPAMHSVIINDRVPNNYKEAIIKASWPSGVKKGDLRKVFLAPQILLPTLPYYGDRIEARLGLFSIPAKDLASEMLDLLGILVSPMQNPSLIAALGITNILRKGINALFGLDGVRMLLSWQGDIGGIKELREQVFVLLSSDVDISTEKISLKNGLLYQGGEILEHIDYLIFSIDVAEHRHDWRVLPDIKSHYDAWNNARSIYNLPKDEYNQYVINLLEALRNSSNIVPIDAERIAYDEIRPILEAGNIVQESLFRSAGFAESEQIIDGEVVTGEIFKSIDCTDDFDYFQLK